MREGKWRAALKPRRRGADFRNVRLRASTILVGALFLLSGGARVAELAIVVFTTVALYMEAGGTSREPTYGAGRSIGRRG